MASENPIQFGKIRYVEAPEETEESVRDAIRRAKAKEEARKKDPKFRKFNLGMKVERGNRDSSSTTHHNSLPPDIELPDDL